METRETASQWTPPPSLSYPNFLLSPTLMHVSDKLCGFNLKAHLALGALLARLAVRIAIETRSSPIFTRWLTVGRSLLCHGAIPILRV